MVQIRGIITHVFEKKEGARPDSLFATVQYESPAGLVEAKMGAYGVRLAKGDFFLAEGTWKSSTYRGRTEEVFNAKVARVDLPSTREGAETWFRSIFTADAHGVTVASVEAFLDRHGPQAAILCERTPEMVVGLSTRPQAFKAAILTEWGRRISGRQAATLMERCGLDPAVIAAVLEALRDSASGMLRDDPYQIARIRKAGANKSERIGFRDADKVGTHMGIAPEDARRVRAALVECLDAVHGEGHTFAGLADVGERMRGTYGITIDTASRYIVSQVGQTDSPIRVSARQSGLVAQTREFHDGELAIAERLARMLSGGRRHNPAAVDAVVRKLFEKPEFNRFDDIQRAAVILAAREPVCILTGGPGTGKSTVSEVVVAAAELLDTGPILLCAPTGKAAKRLAETTGKPASTIHSLLQAREDKARGLTVFGRNARSPLPAECVVVVDEASMLDVTTTRALLEAMPPNGRLILVGDRNQLPSVEAGAVLSDLMSARGPGGGTVVPQAELLNVYRQSRDSRIATGAAQVRQGELPELTNKFVGGLVLYEHEGAEIVNRVKWVVQQMLQNRWRPDQIAVLVPQNPSTAGAWEINRMMSFMLNPEGRNIPGVFRGTGEKDVAPVPRVGDRVMLTENDPDNDVMNGDVGVIVDTSTEKAKGGGERNYMEVAFDCGRRVKYPTTRWRSFSLAYAITIHKSQGSQYPVVIMPVTMAHANMLDRSLLYTGWTRAKSALFLVGEREALQASVETTDASRRDTRLGEFIAAAAAAHGLGADPAVTAPGPDPVPGAVRIPRMPPPPAPAPADAGIPGDDRPAAPPPSVRPTMGRMPPRPGSVPAHDARTEAVAPARPAMGRMPPRPGTVTPTPVPPPVAASPVRVGMGRLPPRPPRASPPRHAPVHGAETDHEPEAPAMSP